MSTAKKTTAKAPVPAVRPAREIPAPPRPMLRSSMTVQDPNDPNASATLQVVVITRGCGMDRCPAGDPSGYLADSRQLVPELSVDREAGWRCVGIGEMEVWVRIIEAF